MKKFFLFIGALAVSAMMWGEDFVINTTNFTQITSGSGYATYNGDRVISGVTITSNDVMINSSKLQFKKSSGCLYNSDELPNNIASITLSTPTGFTIYVGESSNPSETTVASGESVSGKYKYFKVVGNSSGAALTATITITYEEGEVKAVKSVKVTGTAEDIWKGDSFTHNGITVTAIYEEDDSEEDVTNKASYTNYNMNVAGEQTVTVTYGGKSDTYSVNVLTIANTQETAYTIAEAKALVDAGKNLGDSVYVKGKICQIDFYNSTFHSIQYWISDDGTSEGKFEVFSGRNLNNTNFSSTEEIEIGADVVVYGIIKIYGDTYEFDKSNYLVSYIAPAPKTLLSIAITGEAEVTEYEAGDLFDCTGLTVTAYYSDDSNRQLNDNEFEWVVTPVVLAVENTSVSVVAKMSEEVSSEAKEIEVTVQDVGKKLVFDMTSNYMSLPTSKGTSEAGNYTYTLDEVDYTFSVTDTQGASDGGVYFSGTAPNGYMMVYKGNAVGMPALKGYKLSKVKASNTDGCSVNVEVSVRQGDEAESEVVVGGEAQTLTAKGSTYTYTLSGTAANTVYYLYMASANAQITKLQLYYDEVSTPTALDELEENAKDAKILMNGRVYIRHNGYLYNVLGTVVK